MGNEASAPEPRRLREWTLIVEDVIWPGWLQSTVLCSIWLGGREVQCQEAKGLRCAISPQGLQGSMLELIFAIKDEAESCGLAVSAQQLRRLGTPLYLCQWLGLDVEGNGTSLEDARQIAAQEPMAPKVLLTIYREPESLPSLALPSEPALHTTMCGTPRDRSPRGTSNEMEGRLLEMLESLRVSNRVIGRMQRSIYDLQRSRPPSAAPSRGSQALDELAAKVELSQCLSGQVSEQQELESQNASLRQEIVSLGASVANLEGELSARIAALHEMELDRDRLLQDLASHQDARQESERENDELRDQLHRMQSHVAELNQRAEKLNAAGCDLAREQARAAELDTALKQLRGQSVSKDQEHAMQLGQLQLERDRAAELEQALNQLRSQSVSKTQEEATLHEQVQLEQARAEELEQVVRRLESQLATFEQQRLSTQDALHELELERSRAGELETAMAVLQERLRSSERDAATTADLRRQLDDRFAREAELESAMSRLAAQLATREKDKEQLEVKEQQRAIELQAELDGKDQATEALGASLRELEAVRDAMKEELEECAVELEAKEAVLAEWKADWGAKAKELDKTSAALQEVHANRAKEQRLDRLPTFGSDTSQLAQLELELQTAHQALASEQRGVEEQRALALDAESQLREELNALSATAKTEAEHCSELKSEFACHQVHAELASTDQRAAEEARAEERWQKDDALERQIAMLQNELDRCKLGADDAKEEAARLRLQLQATSSQNELQRETEQVRLAASAVQVPKARLAGVPTIPGAAPRYQRLSHTTILNWHRQKEETRREILEPTMENPV